MPYWSIQSESKLLSCKPELIQLGNELIKLIDCSILYGFRTKQEQEKAFMENKSKLHFPYSSHNKWPSRGIDIAPYPIDWSDIRRFYYFGGFVVGMAKKLGIPIRWGGDWDGDFQVKDQNFNDLVHFEFV